MSTAVRETLEVPFFRPSIGEAEIDEVVACLRSGWLTSGPRTRQFECDFGALVGARHALAVNSCTAALHLAVEALGLKAGQVVLVPTMTFAATAEVIRYQQAIPLLIDCDPVTLNLDLNDAEAKLRRIRQGDRALGRATDVVGMIPVHVGGLMLDPEATRSFADRHELWIVEDAAHAFPAGCRAHGTDPWRRCGSNTADVTCFSFYANKTITTGEGGMAVCADDEVADRIRCMSLHGLSHDAWRRYGGRQPWDYRIQAPGFKYNMTDIAAALGIHQVARAESMRCEREGTARYYREGLGDLKQLELPPEFPDRLHAWHLFPIRLRLDQLTIERNRFMEHLRERGVGSSVHWRPLHLHPYYKQMFPRASEELPEATRVWKRLISLPLFPGMTENEQVHVVRVVRELCHEFAKGGGRPCR